MMTKAGKGGGGSCGSLVDYLEKEGYGEWFDRDRKHLAGQDVVAEIDGNKRNLGRDDDKYYQLILAPSDKELAHINGDQTKLQAFVQASMEAYAANFNKGISSTDLVWFAKIEHSRSYDHTDRAVQLGEVAKGTTKPGDQAHVHVIVSRTENLQTYTAGRKNGQHERKNPFHLSPLTNHKATTKGPVVGGFERNAFAQASERTFDLVTGYQRSLVESFAYKHTLKYGDEQAKTLMRQAAAREQATAKPKVSSQLTEATKIVFTPIVKPARQKQAKMPDAARDDLRQQIGTAYRQKDMGDLVAVLNQVGEERNRQEKQRRKEEPQGQKAVQEHETQPKQQQPKADKAPQTDPKQLKTGLKR